MSDYADLAVRRMSYDGWSSDDYPNVLDFLRDVMAAKRFEQLPLEPTLNRTARLDEHRRMRIIDGKENRRLQFTDSREPDEHRTLHHIIREIQALVTQ